MNLAMRMQSKTKQEELLLLQSLGSICSSFLLLLKDLIRGWDGAFHTAVVAASRPGQWGERINVLFEVSVALTLTQPPIVRGVSRVLLPSTFWDRILQQETHYP